MQAIRQNILVPDNHCLNIQIPHSIPSKTEAEIIICFEKSKKEKTSQNLNVFSGFIGNVKMRTDGSINHDNYFSNK